MKELTEQELFTFALEQTSVSGLVPEAYHVAAEKIVFLSNVWAIQKQLTLIRGIISNNANSIEFLTQITNQLDKQMSSMWEKWSSIYDK
jgi:hypothetical protein